MSITEWRKRESILVAKQLGYGKEIISRLKTANSASEVEHIMCTARHAMEM